MNADEGPSGQNDSEYQRFLAIARELAATGRSVDEVLGALRAEGAYAIPSIKVLRELYGYSLADAKDRLHASPVWADEVPYWERLQEQLSQAFVEYEAELDRNGRDQAG